MKKIVNLIFAAALLSVPQLILAVDYPPDRATATPIRPAIVGSDGTLLDLQSWARSYNYNADGTLNYEEVTDGVSIWRRTYIYGGGNLTGETVWVKQ